MTRLRVLTFNVQSDHDGDERRIELINQEIGRLDPDLVSLQEVSPGCGSTGLDRVLAGLDLASTHQNDVLGYPMPFADRYGGAALATRWPHRLVEVVDQRGVDAPDVPWCTLAAAVEIPNLGDLVFIGATFSWRLDAEATRERQALALTDLDARHRGSLPTIIAGDLNATPDAACIRYLAGQQALSGRSVCYHDAWRVANPGAAEHDGATWSIDNARAASEMAAIIRQPQHHRRLDYVFVGSWHAHPRARAEVQAASLVFNAPIEGRWLSDHYGLLVDLEVSADPESSP